MPPADGIPDGGLTYAWTAEQPDRYDPVAAIAIQHLQSRRSGAIRPYACSIATVETVKLGQQWRQLDALERPKHR